VLAMGSPFLRYQYTVDISHVIVGFWGFSLFGHGRRNFRHQSLSSLLVIFVRGGEAIL
jgi:hypothetical protein